jgi:hypothetical protein
MFVDVAVLLLLMLTESSCHPSCGACGEKILTLTLKTDALSLVSVFNKND